MTFTLLMFIILSVFGQQGITGAQQLEIERLFHAGQPINPTQSTASGPTAPSTFTAPQAQLPVPQIRTIEPIAPVVNSVPLYRPRKTQTKGF